ncbi:MAG: alanine--glyoxylate aminotransferase family protein [Bacteroidetes bacterium]|nr:alanine--glyoxylate aminotransferase family protein [Bacteroidota bacterium]
MNKIYFTPGPTELYPEARRDIDEALKNKVCSINHRSTEFMDIYKNTVYSLKKLMNIPDDFHIFFLSSATECMDRIIQNCSEKRTFHFVNGAFADRFYKTASDLKREAAVVKTDYGTGFNFSGIEIQNDPELICVTQNETSTGVTIDPQNIYDIKEQNPGALIAVDIVTSAPYVKIDFNKIDCAFFSVQKGFGLPAGLGVLIVNAKCIRKAEYLKSSGAGIGSYHNFLTLLENAEKYQTSETPNVLGIYLLGKVSDYLNGRGIDTVRSETEEKSDLLYGFFERNTEFTPFVKKVSDRSKTIIVIETGNRQTEVKKKLSDNNILVGSGYGKLKESQIRIANFPMHKAEDVKRITEILS